MSRELVYDNTDSLTGGRPVRQGFYNTVDVFVSAGTFKWDKKSLLDPNSHILVRVWGAGGSCGVQAASGNAYGGGGGGLAVKRISVSDLSNSETLVVGAGQAIYNAQAGASSFGNHCSATGGNSGYNNADNAGRTVYGGGGMGIGGDLNRRGGDGGSGVVSSKNGGGGGGGSAPHPDGHQDGFRGGNYTNNSGGSGASINYPGIKPYTSNNSAGGSGTAGRGTPSVYSNHELSYGGQGGAGLLGAGGHGASIGIYSNNTISIAGAESGQGTAIIEPNRVFFGGGGGGGGAASRWSSARGASNGGNGGPGAGGGSSLCFSDSGHAPYTLGGNGGILGGGGGSGQHCTGGDGGNAGGGGSGGYSYGTNTKHGFGGHGLVIIQYRLLFSN